MRTGNSINTYIDTLGLRCVCYTKYDRDALFNSIVTFLSKKHIVGIVNDNKNSNKYYQTIKLQYANSTLATISKGYFEQTSKSRYKTEYYYINISFYGLIRYDKIKDNTSRLLVQIIAAYLNTNNIDFKLMELDLAMDIKSNPDNILAICTRRTAHVNYYDLGDYTINNNKIQNNDGTYYIEKFESFKQKKNAMSRAYLYDKRQKERDKFKRDIGFELTRFELKLQKKFFVKNEYDGSFLFKAIAKYSILYFEDIKQKELFIQQFNSTKTSRKRKNVISQACDSYNAFLLTPMLSNVCSFLRDIDSITFDTQGNFKYIKHENYLYCQSKFNRRY